ncbi:hypothetical protein M758_10G165100 [Ceratodon purpureus]|uniref:Uncharacterized protein n=1 Tax=Ceratodon purpureus TaxID=3225 RepID=A0A8T0GP83_CERPU|nr:hypothetical protein KC19_10G169600 [Ceratodon purpureus]KAG0604347.1 hypothetical protein M758_10G165100 [Ceratodon purpureus]
MLRVYHSGNLGRSRLFRSYKLAPDNGSTTCWAPHNLRHHKLEEECYRSLTSQAFSHEWTKASSDKGFLAMIELWEAIMVSLCLGRCRNQPTLESNQVANPFG